MGTSWTTGVITPFGPLASLLYSRREASGLCQSWENFMSVNMIRIDISELKTIRVICKSCRKGVVEMSVENLQHALTSKGRCRFCDHDIMAGMSNPTPLMRFQEAFISLVQLKREIDIEIEIPTPSAATQNQDIA
jgi:hypothetical protein